MATTAFGAVSTSTPIYTSAQADAQSDYDFGSGSDGDVTISGDTTITRAMYYNNLTVDSGFNLITANNKIYVKGTCTINGTIHQNGNNGSNATGQAGASGGAIIGTADAGSSSSGGGGGAGGTGV